MSGEELRAARALLEDVWSYFDPLRAGPRSWDEHEEITAALMEWRAALAAPSTPEPSGDHDGHMCYCGDPTAEHRGPIQHWAAPSTPEPSGLTTAIDAIADALNGWDQGEEPRPDSHRHWLTILAALAAPSTEPALERLRTAIATVAYHRRLTVPGDFAADIADEYARLAESQR